MSDQRLRYSELSNFIVVCKRCEGHAYFHEWDGIITVCCKNADCKEPDEQLTELDA